MMKKTSNRIMFYVILVLTGSMLAACSGPMVKNTVSATDPAYQAIIPEEPYRIHAGDSLDVKFYYNPELNETVTVRPDRKISLQLVHDVMAAGFTPEELSQILADKYRKEVKKPVITVIVRTFNGHKVYVDGEVTRPGMQAMVEEMTLLQSVSGAGGFKPTARLNEILVLR